MKRSQPLSVITRTNRLMTENKNFVYQFLFFQHEIVFNKLFHEKLDLPMFISSSVVSPSEGRNRLGASLAKNWHCCSIAVLCYELWVPFNGQKYELLANEDA